MDDHTGDEDVHGEEDSCHPLPLFDHDNGHTGRYGRNRSEPLSYTGPGPSRSSTSSSSRSMGGVYAFDPFHNFSRPMSPSSRSSSVDTLSMCEPPDMGNDTEGQMGLVGVGYGTEDSSQKFKEDDSKLSFWENFWEILGYLPSTQDETVYASQSCHQPPVNLLGSRIPRSMPIPDDSIDFSDGLGRLRRLPVQYFRHWQVFEAMLKCDFAGMPGDTHVQQKQYHMLHGPTARPVSAASWSKICVPRASINMSMVMVKIRRKKGLCPRPGCEGKTPLKMVSAGYKCADCNLRYFPESQSAAPMPTSAQAWASSLAALAIDDEATTDPASQPAWLPRVAPWLHEQHIAMANLNEGGSAERSPDEDRLREMRELRSFRTIHIDEMSRDDEPSPRFKRRLTTFPKKREMVMPVQSIGRKDNAETTFSTASSNIERPLRPPCFSSWTSFSGTEMSSDNRSTSSRGPQSSKSSDQSFHGSQPSTCPSPVLHFAPTGKASQPGFLTLAPVLGIPPAPQAVRKAEVRNVTLEDYAVLLRSGKLTSLYYELSSSKKTVSTQPLRYDPRAKTITLSGLSDEVESAHTTIATFLDTYHEKAADQPERTLFTGRRVEEIERKFNLLDEEANPSDMTKSRGLLPSKAHSLSPHKGTAEAASMPGVLGPEEKELSEEWNSKIVRVFQAQMGALNPGNYIVGLLMRDSEGERTPVISVQTERELSSENQQCLASSVKELDGVGPNWKNIHFQYFVGPVGRSTSTTSETPELTDTDSTTSSEYCKSTREPIFPPQRRRYCKKPDIGTSIGTTRICQHTGTLGAFLCVDGEPRALSVAHLSTECSLGQRCGFSHRFNVKGHDITQPSRADIHDVDKWIGNLEYLLYGGILKNDTPANQEEILKCLDQAHKIREEMLDAISKDSLHFGTHLHSSNEGDIRQNHMGGATAMDWALYVVHPERLNHNTIKPVDDGDSYDGDLSDANPEIPCSGFAPHVPGGLVSAVGRTSGYQVGRINTALYPVCFNGVATLEWGIGNPEDENAHFWDTKGPLGQFGDSGALVVNKNDGKACGLIWGSQLADNFPVAIFTPLEMVFDDIREKCGAQRIQLLAPSFDLELGSRTVSSGSEETAVASIFEDKGAARAESERTSVFEVSVGSCSSDVMARGMKTWDDNVWLPLL